MARSDTDAVLKFYQTHPISEKQILDKLTAEGVDLSALTEEELRFHDQDHFGGIEANDALAALARVTSSDLVLDVCCGLGGPSRYLANKVGCRIVGVDLTESRIAGAIRLTDMTGLSSLASFMTGNALDLPFDDATFDVAISQEAFCHIPDKHRLISECVRVLKPGGRIAFTDILATEATAAQTLARLERGLEFRELASRASYVRMLEDQDCRVEATEDLGDHWRIILVDRLAMYRSLADQTIARFGRAHFERWDEAYSFFVGCFGTGELSGGRFLAHREGD